MLSRNLKRALLDSRWPNPPTFLLPWAAGLTTASHTSATDIGAPPIPQTTTHIPSRRSTTRPNPALESSNATSSETTALPPPGATSAPSLSPSVREYLPILKAQGPHYITAHIHGRPYLVTAGDVIKLPFHMPDVNPGDVLRLNRAVNLGSREFTMKAAAAGPRLKSPTMDTTNILDTVNNSALATASRQMPGASQNDAPAVSESGAVQYAPHFIPNIAKGKHGYLDDRLFVCRAVVTGVESEPLRIKEKTKRRQRHIKRVKSKHRFTFLRVKELRIRGLEEMEAMANGEEVDD